MSWEVSSSTYGGQQYSVDDRASYDSTVQGLTHASDEFSSLSISWTFSVGKMETHRQSCATWCPMSNGTQQPVCSSMHIPASVFKRMSQRCGQHGKDCKDISTRLGELANLLVRALSLYSEAEATMNNIITRSVQILGVLLPGPTTLVVAALAAGGAIATSVDSGKFNPVGALTSTAAVQEGAVRAFGTSLSGTDPLSSLLSKTTANKAAGTVSSFSAPLNDATQGNVLGVNQVRPSTPVVGESHSVEESLEQLRRLSEGTANGTSLNSGLTYGTIAIQQYRRKDGSRSWLVTIPGTDGQADSPFGWPQNAELMSDERTQRLRADSARMVAEAMRRAGIARDEPVVLVGHSQGGIVAAVVASDMRDRYTVSHVVTAGSPVANHPIDDDTWVTSVEMDDELVAALDGSRNPMRDHWLTVRGTAHPISGTDPTVNDDGSCMPGSKEPSRYYAGSPVVGAPRDKELTHALRYHQAAWNNAKDLNSPALSEHERHFEEIIDGELQETTYWQGRMGH